MRDSISLHGLAHIEWGHKRVTPSRAKGNEMKVAIHINGLAFIGEAGTWDEAEEVAMKGYAEAMRIEMSLPEMQGDEDQAWLQSEVDAATHHGLAHLDSLKDQGIAIVDRIDGPMNG